MVYIVLMWYHYRWLASVSNYSQMLSNIVYIYHKKTLKIKKWQRRIYTIKIKEIGLITSLWRWRKCGKRDYRKYKFQYFDIFIIIPIFWHFHHNSLVPVKNWISLMLGKWKRWINNISFNNAIWFKSATSEVVTMRCG